MGTTAEQWVKGFDVKSESSSRLYHIACHASGPNAGTWACSCPRFISHKERDSEGRTTCKHLRGAGLRGPVEAVNATKLSVKAASRSSDSFSDSSYAHYDTSRGFGSAEEWFRKADEAAKGRSTYRGHTGQREYAGAAGAARQAQEQARRESEQQARERARTHRSQYSHRTHYAPPPPRHRTSHSQADDLVLMGLNAMPADVAGLKSAMRTMAFKVHPDYGGSAQAFTAMFDAYERLLKVLLMTYNERLYEAFFRGDGRKLRVPGHKLTMRWSGEYGVESTSTGECPCGWTEFASNQREVRAEYRHHLASLKESS